MIRIEDEGALRVVTIDRPGKANALTGAMLEGLCEAASTPPGCTALVLTGAGHVFSAGADLEQARSGLATSPLWERLSSRLVEAPVLTVAALNGTAAGGALGMVLACDLRVAAPSATFFYPVMKLGFLPQPSDPGRLAALIGPARAKLMLMAGRRFEAGEALDCGLVDRIDADPVAGARDLAAHALGASPDFVSAIKALCAN